MTKLFPTRVRVRNYQGPLSPNYPINFATIGLPNAVITRNPNTDIPKIIVLLDLAHDSRQVSSCYSNGVAQGSQLGA